MLKRKREEERKRKKERYPGSRPMSAFQKKHMGTGVYAKILYAGRGPHRSLVVPSTYVCVCVRVRKRRRKGNPFVPHAKCKGPVYNRPAIRISMRLSFHPCVRSYNAILVCSVFSLPFLIIFLFVKLTLHIDSSSYGAIILYMFGYEPLKFAKEDKSNCIPWKDCGVK